MSVKMVLYGFYGNGGIYKKVPVNTVHENISIIFKEAEDTFQKFHFNQLQ